MTTLDHIHTLTCDPQGHRDGYPVSLCCVDCPYLSRQSQGSCAPDCKGRPLTYWPTTITVQCRNEPAFQAQIRFVKKDSLDPDWRMEASIHCPHCARVYTLQSDGTWYGDRPLKILD